MLSVLEGLDSRKCNNVMKNLQITLFLKTSDLKLPNKQHKKFYNSDPKFKK